MKTIEINAENWTGENEKVTLYSDGKTFKVYDEKFKVVSDGEDCWKLMAVDEQGGELFDTDCRGWTLDGPSWYFQNWSGDIYRESTKDVRLAAAKLLFMIY